MERRRFIVKAGGVLVAAGATTAVNAPNVIAQPRFQWRMPTFWSPANDVLLGNAQKFAKMVDEMSAGRFKVHASYTKFQETIGEWSEISEGPYYSLLAQPLPRSCAE